MKYIKAFIFVFALGIFLSCEDPLERGPLNIISENNVWDLGDEALVNSYIANLYARTEFYPGAAAGNIHRLVVDACAGGYCRTFGPWPAGYQFIQGLFTNQGTGGNGVNEYWRWDLVRDINTALERLDVESSAFDQEFKEATIGELHFLRAWVYFQKVKRYGGIPLIDKVQTLESGIENLSVARSSEEEIYDFIAAECDLAKSMLENKSQDRGRANYWAALALKSRAMMYAGSVGEFGSIQLNGLLGIGDADKYWQLSYDASKEIIDNGGFALFGTGSPDFATAEQKYYELFTKAEANGEEIMGDIYNGEGAKPNDWERWCAPALVGGTTFLNTFLETYEMYEFTDGTPGNLDRNTLVEGVFHDISDFILGKDPRARANTFLPESQYMGQTVWMHEGVYIDGVLHTSSETIPAGADLGGVPIQGPARDIQRTGFFNKKRSNEDMDVASVQGIGSTDYMIFRLGEIYLNLAEAAFALERNDEALEALNTIRRRVNMPDKPAISWEVIQNERAVELAFEHHRYWDLRRWRIAEEKLDSDNILFSGVRWRKDISNPGMYEIIHQTSGTATDHFPRSFEPHHYYFPIGLARIQRSPELIENPGY